MTLTPLKGFFILAAVTFTILGSVASFNFHVDPMCYYRCDAIDLDKSTMNTYYHVGQLVLAYPKAQVVMLGSSRGQTSPPLWIQKRTGLQTLNLSMGGAELSAKLAFLNLALEKLKVKKVIWFADYFELTSSIADAKIKNTQALRKYLDSDQNKNLTHLTDELSSLIDHNTLEASFYALKKSAKSELDQGSGSHLDIELCASEKYKGERSFAEMEKEKGFIYDAYTRKVLKAPQSEEAWRQFTRKMNFLNAKGIDVLVLITPYNPDFTERLKKEFPEIYSRHIEWINKLKSISLPHVKIADYFNGLPEDDKTQRFWNDGVHFTCKGSIAMLKREL